MSIRTILPALLFGALLSQVGQPLAATFNSELLSWEQLPTSVDTGQGLILALGPHFSIYAVATYRGPRDLPVTGASLPAIPAVYLLIICCLLGLFHLVRATWRSQC